MKIKRGCLYLADLTPRFGAEPGKTRPVVVIQNDLLNEIPHSSTWILPCTTQLTPSNVLRVRLPKAISGNEKECDVMVDLSRSIDNRRFNKKLGEIPATLFDEIIEKLCLVGGL